jgi:hypothetical protein
MHNDHPNNPSLHLIVKRGLIPLIFPLFQKGVLINGRLGCSIRSFIHEQLGFSDQYIEKRIQTFFLDGKAVDDIDSAYIHDGSILALSASMPGLLGATLRKGSYYASMRSTISYNRKNNAVIPHEGTVRLKLFNLLISEMAPGILKQGVWVEGKELQEFLARHPKRFWSDCVEVVANGKSVEPAELARMTWEDKVFLRVQEID